MKKDEQITVFDIDGIDGRQGHGGKRKGSGRKKGEPTTLIRVCEDIETHLKQVSDHYKTLTPEQKRELRINLNNLTDAS